MQQRQLQLGFNDLLPIGITLGVSALAIAYLAQAEGDARDDMITNTAGCNSTDVSACGFDYNISGNSLEGLNNLSARFGTLGTVAAAAVIIGVVVTFLAFQRS